MAGWWYKFKGYEVGVHIQWGGGGGSSKVVVVDIHGWWWWQIFTGGCGNYSRGDVGNIHGGMWEFFTETLIPSQEFLVASGINDITYVHIHTHVRRTNGAKPPPGGDWRQIRTKIV